MDEATVRCGTCLHSWEPEYWFCPNDGDLLLLGRAVGGEWVLHAKLGSGAMGAVYRAQHRLVPQRQAAVKILGPHVVTGETAAEVQRFLREALVSVRHRHCVAIEDIGRIDAVRGKGSALWWIRMEYVEGTSLDHLLARGPLPAARVIALGAQMCAGLQACHEAKEAIVHRDFKPANVLIAAATGEAKVADFGLVRIAGQPTLTSSNAILGSPLYMSPEQLAGPDVEAPSDLFALGLVLYEMITGRRPFENPSDTSLLHLMRRVTTEDPPPFHLPAGACPPGLEDLVLRLLRKDPARRFPSAAAVREALLDLEPVRVRVFNGDIELSVELDVHRSTSLQVLRTEALARASLSSLAKRIVDNPRTEFHWSVDGARFRDKDTIADACKAGGDARPLALHLRVIPDVLLGS